MKKRNFLLASIIDPFLAFDGKKFRVKVCRFDQKNILYTIKEFI